ncbi:MAG: prolipoprotein diacylglyceryl transferase [bacterium]|nr:prolipoprotein diacylglyceryl transferase [bacterium]
MHPILVKLGPVTIHTYGFLLAIGVLLAILISIKLGKKEGLDTHVLSDFIFFTILIGLIGAKIFLFITELDYYLKYPREIWSLLTSAGTFYGGLIFGAVFVIWYVRKHKLSMFKVGDVMTPAVAIAHFFGRMGCFSAGCCWGREAPEGCIVGVTFTSTQTTTGVPLNQLLYGTQLIEAILNLLNFIILIILFKKKQFQGQVLAVYVFNYALIRFCVEFFRGDHDRGYVFGGINHPFSSLSVPQLISLIGIAIGIAIYFGARKRGKAKEGSESKK